MSKNNDNDWIGYVVAGGIGALFGAAIVHLMTRPTIDRLEARIIELERHGIDMNQTIITMKGHMQSQSGFIREINERVKMLEGETRFIAENYDWIINELEFAINQIENEEIKLLIKQLIEHAKQRKAERVEYMTRGEF